MVFPLVTGLFFNAIWLMVRRVFAMLRAVHLEQLETNLRIANLEREQLEDTNLDDTDIEQQPFSPQDLIALTARVSSTEQ